MDFLFPCAFLSAGFQDAGLGCGCENSAVPFLSSPISLLYSRRHVAPLYFVKGGWEPFLRVPGIRYEMRRICTSTVF